MKKAALILLLVFFAPEIKAQFCCGVELPPGTKVSVQSKFDLEKTTEIIENKIKNSQNLKLLSKQKISNGIALFFTLKNLNSKIKPPVLRIDIINSGNTVVSYIKPSFYLNFYSELSKYSEKTDTALREIVSKIKSLN